MDKEIQELSSRHHFITTLSNLLINPFKQYLEIFILQLQNNLIKLLKKLTHTCHVPNQRVQRISQLMRHSCINHGQK